MTTEITLEQHMTHTRETLASITKLCPWCEREREAVRNLGRRGGLAGRGEAKRRGDSAYYKALRAKVKTYKATFKGKTVKVTIPED